MPRRPTSRRSSAAATAAGSWSSRRSLLISVLGLALLACGSAGYATPRFVLPPGCEFTTGEREDAAGASPLVVACAKVDAADRLAREAERQGWTSCGVATGNAYFVKQGSVLVIGSGRQDGRADLVVRPRTVECEG